MSRIGKKPIKIPQGVTVEIEEERVKVKGPKGELSLLLKGGVKVEKEKDFLKVIPPKKGKNKKAFWGLFRTLLFNMVKGVSEGFEKKLEIRGVGYKARLEGKKLVLSVGFSHDVDFIPPEDINISVEKNIITVSGMDKQKVGEIAARIRRIRPPDPYKGKGIRYLGEEVKTKVGKKVASTGT